MNKLVPSQSRSSYLAYDCILVSKVAGQRHLRSADTTKLSLQRTRTVISTQSFCSMRLWVGRVPISQSLR